MKLRKYGPAFPNAADLMAWAEARKDPSAQPWAEFVGATLFGLETVPVRALSEHVTLHLTVAERLARGLDPAGSGALWGRGAGAEARILRQELAAEAPHGGDFSALAYRDLFEACLLYTSRCV